MQQIYLTGPKASQLAQQVLSSLRVKTAGYRLLPLEVGGGARGSVVHLLTTPDQPHYNDVPCAISIGPGEQLVLHDVYNCLVAPALRQAAAARVPILLDSVSRAALEASGYAAAVRECLNSRCQVIVVAEESAAAPLRAMTDEADQLWLDVTEVTGPAAMQQLAQELTMRL